MRLAILAAVVVSFAACDGNPKGGTTVDPDIAASVHAFANRHIYTRLDPAVLSKIPDSELEQAIFDYVITKLDGHYDREEAIVANLPAGVRALYLTWTVEAEVNNGGFNQYYFNTDGKFASNAVDAFQYFGASEHAMLMREANAVRAAETKLMEQYKKQGTVEAFSESYKHSKLGSLDDRFYKLGENLSQLRIARVRLTPEQFSGE